MPEVKECGGSLIKTIEISMRERLQYIMQKAEAKGVIGWPWKVSGDVEWSLCLLFMFLCFLFVFLYLLLLVFMFCTAMNVIFLRL